MGHLPDIEGFLAEGVRDEPDHAGGLSLDKLYGVYTSWCLLHDLDPETPNALWRALEARGINPSHNHLAIKGQAAANYTIASAPNII